MIYKRHVWGTQLVPGNLYFYDTFTWMEYSMICGIECITKGSGAPWITLRADTLLKYCGNIKTAITEDGDSWNFDLFLTYGSLQENTTSKELRGRLIAWNAEHERTYYAYDTNLATR